MKSAFRKKEADFFSYDEPGIDLCLHKELNLANVHHRVVSDRRSGHQEEELDYEEEFKTVSCTLHGSYNVGYTGFLCLR